MWLLSTDRAELRCFPSLDVIDGGYAILSHTWGHNESTFQDLQELERRCKLSGENPRDLVPSKVRNCCVVAERDGFQWVWVDTCCIDKTSSTELSEAINSMFKWYSESEVCYAFLADVPSDDVIGAPNSAFRRARWHTRGWTLQELIAPIHLIFLSPDHSGQWTRIGDKINLAPLLHEITGVPARVLTREDQFYDVSVAERMAWASMRTTVRIEDEAYALMGLFNINMPTIYGEGRRAFCRLQEEIMKQSFDTSLFAWGDSENGLPGYASSLPFSKISTTFRHDPLLYLLAPSPRWFSGRCGGTKMEFTPNSTAPLQPRLSRSQSYSSGTGVDYPKVEEPSGVVELPEFSMTSIGMKCRFPVADLEDGYAVAVLFCYNNKGHIGLLLHPSNFTPPDPSPRRYNVGYYYRCVDGTEGIGRLAFLGNNIRALVFKGKPITTTWRDIYVAEGLPPALDDHGLSLSYSLSSITPAPPFRIPRWLVRKLELLGMQETNVRLHSLPAGRKPLLISFSLSDPEWLEVLCITLGTCGKPSSSGHSVRWARADFGRDGYWEAGLKLTHDCAVHHIDAWPGLAKTFGDSKRTARLSFTPCRLAPEHTLVLHIELEGTVYEKLRRDHSVRFPPTSPPVPPQSPESAASSHTARRSTPPSNTLPKSYHYKRPRSEESSAAPPLPPAPGAPDTPASSSVLASGTQNSSRRSSRRSTKRRKPTGEDGFDEEG